MRPDWSVYSHIQVILGFEIKPLPEKVGAIHLVGLHRGVTCLFSTCSLLEVTLGYSSTRISSSLTSYAFWV